MLAFLWILSSVGVAYGAKISGRNAFAWFVIALCATPLLGSVALITANRYGCKKSYLPFTVRFTAGA